MTNEAKAKPIGLAIGVVLVLAIAFVAVRFRDELRFFYDLMTSQAPQSLPVPVKGVAAKSLADSWGAPRGRDRTHKGIDIFARRGTPVTAPVAGLVTDVGTDSLGGNVVRLLGPGRQIHYFAHLDAAAVREWQRVQRGHVIGFVGDTGNARGTPPHLHYGIYTPAAGAINPYPLLVAPSRP